MSDSSRQTISLTIFFASFVFLQFTVLGLGNHAGEGYLPTNQRELVYYGIQVFVILGYWSYALARRLSRLVTLGRVIQGAVLAVCFAGSAVLLAAEGSRFQLVVTFATVFCLGCLGSAVYERMSQASASGGRVALVMGLSYTAAIALQYVLQLRWGVTPALPVFTLAAFGVLAVFLLGKERTSPAAPSPVASPRALLFTLLIAAILLLFSGFYNSYIHHLQVVSGYTDYNVYAWPRLMLIPGYLFFGAIGDRWDGRLVPVAAVCVALAALLNAALVASNGAYWLNMCLFYIALSGAVSYYNLAFWRLAQGTKWPAFWASMGRVLDSGVVLVTFALGLSGLPVPAILAIDVAGLAAVILLLALGGQFSAPAPTSPPSAADPETTLAVMRERYGLTNRETEVLRELVCTEDKQAAIAARLGVKEGTIQFHTTALYRKTGAGTRAGLCELYFTAARELQ